MREWIVAAACCVFTSAHAAPVGTTVVLDRSIVRVGAAVIWESEVDARMRGANPQDRPAVIDSMIDEELIVTEALKVPITVDKSEVMAALDEIKAQNKLDDAGLDKALADYGYTRARYLLDLERQLLILRARNQFIMPRVMVTDADVAAEAKAQGKAKPTDDEKAAIQSDLRKKQAEAETVKWIADLRKRAWIERRP